MFKEGRDSYPKIFMSPKIEVRESSIHGLGVFAKEQITTNELIEGAPVILFHKDTCDTFDYNQKREVHINPAGGLRIEGVHDRHVLMDYPFTWKDKMLAFGMGYAGVYNHSTEEPNARWSPNFEHECVDISAKRTIEPGEEITIRYVEYKYCDTLWFVSDEPNRKLDRPLEIDRGDWRDVQTDLRKLDDQNPTS
jgi:hypothetical protein